jgi:hypothetical protein
MVDTRSKKIINLIDGDLHRSTPHRIRLLSPELRDKEKTIEAASDPAEGLPHLSRVMTRNQTTHTFSQLRTLQALAPRLYPFPSGITTEHNLGSTLNYCSWGRVGNENSRYEPTMLTRFDQQTNTHFSFTPSLLDETHLFNLS